MTGEPDEPPGPGTSRPGEGGLVADDLGGEPVCWLDRVCPRCGSLAEDRTADTCPGCETPLLR